MTLLPITRKRKSTSAGLDNGNGTTAQSTHDSTAFLPQQNERSRSASDIFLRTPDRVVFGSTASGSAESLLKIPSPDRDGFGGRSSSKISSPGPSPLSDSTSPGDSISLPVLSEICYGMITDILVVPTSLLSSKPILDDQSNCETSWPVGFISGTAVLLNAQSEAVGQLSIAHSSILNELKQRIPSLRCEVFLVSSEASQFDRSKLRKAFQAAINIYGDRGYRDIAGEELDSKEIFLQEPSFMDKMIPYSNPHVYSTTNDRDTPYFASQHNQVQRKFDAAITFVLNESTAYNQDLDFVQDERIRTPLEQHQIAAIKFALSREAAFLDRGTPTLWRPIGTSLGLRYRHCLSGVMDHTPHNECRGGLLADEMGMGKSLSMLALVVHTLTEAGEFASFLHQTLDENIPQPVRATLIVTPKSSKVVLHHWGSISDNQIAIESWVNEIKGHLSCVDFTIYHGPNKEKALPEFERVAIVLTTYETAARACVSQENPLARYRWFRVILDEAHQIRNMSTQIFSAVNRLDTQRRWCLTGTPVQNGLNDIFALTTFLKFFPFSTRKDIKTYITGPLSRYDKQGLTNLRAMMRVCSIRRSKKDLELPAIKFEEHRVMLSKAERRQYESVKADLLKDLVRAARKESKQTTAVTLRGIQKLRQICCHGLQHTNAVDCEELREDHLVPNICSRCANDLSVDSRTKATQLQCGHQLCEDCSASSETVSGRPCDSELIACSLCDQLDDVVALDEDCEEPLSSNSEPADHDMKPPAHVLEVSKINAVISSLKQLHQHGPSANDNTPTTKSLVFSYWIRALNTLETALQPLQIPYIRIDGQTTLEQRQQAIAKFRTDPTCQIALMTFGTGSVGLNLTVASHVHLVEPHWNPMVEEQAAARAHRIGQTQPVTVYRYIVQDSIEEQIRNKQRRKLYLASLAGVRDESSVRTGEQGRRAVGDLDTVLEKWHLV